MTQRERIAERRRNVAVLHEQGRSLREIALRLNVGRTTVHRDLEALQGRVSSAGVPAGPGNTRALTHGLDSSRLQGQIEQRARELAPAIVDAHGHLDRDRDGLAVLRYAMDLARLERAWAWLGEQADDLFLDSKAGDVHALHGRMAGWEAAAARAEERLAISPRERTRLKLEKLGFARGVAGDGDRIDLSALSDAELDLYVRLREKVVTAAVEAS